MREESPEKCREIAREVGNRKDWKIKESKETIS
jgi:hypothetical protein